MKKIILLLFLLSLFGGGGYYYFLHDPNKPLLSLDAFRTTHSDNPYANATSLSNTQLEIDLQIHPQFLEQWKAASTVRLLVIARINQEKFNYFQLPRSFFIFNKVLPIQNTKNIQVTIGDSHKIKLLPNHNFELITMLCLNASTCDVNSPNLFVGRSIHKLTADKINKITMPVNFSGMKRSSKNGKFFDAQIYYDPEKLKKTNKNWYLVLHGARREPNSGGKQTKLFDEYLSASTPVAVVGPIPLNTNTSNISILPSQAIIPNFTGRLQAQLTPCDDFEGDYVKCALVNSLTRSAEKPVYYMRNTISQDEFSKTEKYLLEQVSIF